MLNSGYLHHYLYPVYQTQKSYLPCLIAGFLFFSPAIAETELHYQLANQPVSVNTPRLGLNLGEWSAWGAGQFSANVLKNPGFEGLIDRAIVIVKTADGRSFSDDTAWTKRPDGFWAGAQFDVRSGGSAGKQGVIFDSKAKGQQGLPEFSTTGHAPDLKPGDVIALTRSDDKKLPAQWWYTQTPVPGQLAVSNDTRPKSPGIRSLALRPLPGKPVEALSYLDSISDRAGKLLPVKGEWAVRFWLKQTEPGAKVNVSFSRANNSKAFFKETFQPTAQWQLIERRFRADDNGPAGTLALTLQAEGNTGQVLLDDIELGAFSKQSYPFRAELLAALKQLKPGYLRDWQGQLGDTFTNRTAGPFARRSTRYRPGDDSSFSYGLQDFLQLAHDINAVPWVIVPPTLSDSELEQFGHYLSQQIAAFNFQEMIVEFGNENWNAMFRPAGIPDYQAHGQVATRAFQYLLAGAKQHPALRPVVNGQYVNPWLSTKYLQGVSNAQGVAIAPYFLFKLNAGDDVLGKLFEQDDFYRETLAATQAQGKELLVYEINLHTTAGDASIADRAIATTSAASGAALAKRLLTGLNLGIQRQCLYTLAQYDAYLEAQNTPRELVKLWGIARDLGENQRLRPTGLVMAMLNQALPADVYPLKNIGAEDKGMTLSAFKTSKTWAVAAVSGKAQPQKITVQLPEPALTQSWRLLQLASPSPTADNETKEQVKIVQEPLSVQGNMVSFTVPPYGVVMAVAAE